MTKLRTDEEVREQMSTAFNWKVIFGKNSKVQEAIIQFVFSLRKEDMRAAFWKGYERGVAIQIEQKHLEDSEQHDIIKALSTLEREGK